MRGEICRLDGCGKPAKMSGLCQLHYGRYLRGIIDKEGRILRPFRDRLPVNTAIRSTLRMAQEAGRNAGMIREKISEGDRHLRRRVNRRLLDINEQTARQERRLRDRDFVFGNIHVMQPQTVQMILGERPVEPRKRLSVEDKARIAWHLLRGRKSEYVVKMFPMYSLGQVRAVAAQIRSGRLPVAREVLEGRRA